jgi:hypothetical protein
MQIQLKQAEIRVALCDYITKKGIDLSGKTVDIAFTSSRKPEAGLIADLSIEDMGIPPFTANNDNHVHATAAVLSLVKVSASEQDSVVAVEETLTDDLLSEKVTESSIVDSVANTELPDSVLASPMVTDKPKSLFN